MNYTEIPYLLYKHQDRFFLLDSSYGDLLEIGEVLYDVLYYAKCMNENELIKYLSTKYSKDEILTVLKELHNSNRKFLVRQSLLNDIINSKRHYSETPRILCFNIAQTCNLKCKYCFVEEMSSCQPLKYMSKDIIKRSIDFWKKSINSIDKEYLVGFFGGEPLLNTELIKEAVECINRIAQEEGLKINYTVTTNGTIMNQKLSDFLKINKFDMYFSVEGCEWIQNKNRPFRGNNAGTHKVIIENIKKYFLDYDKFTCLMTLLPEDIPYLAESVKKLWNIGVKRVSVTLVFGKLYNYTYQDYKEFDKQIQIIANEMYNHLLNNQPYILENLLSTMQMIHYKEYKVNCYLWHNRMVTFATDGEVYSCQRFVGHKMFSLGNVREKIDYSNATLPKDKIEKCRKCPYELYCGDGCPYENLIYHDDINKPAEEFCNQLDIIFNNSIQLYLRLLCEAPDSLKVIKK